MAGRVLIVDDDPLTLEILATILDLEEFDVDRATRGDDALELARANAYDVVVSDLTMPGLSGFELAAALRAEPATEATRVILLTASDTVEDRETAIASGAAGYLTKPFSPLELIATIRDVLAV